MKEIEYKLEITRTITQTQRVKVKVIAGEPITMKELQERGAQLCLDSCWDNNEFSYDQFEILNVEVRENA